MAKCSNDGLMGAAVTGKPVTECQDLSEVFRASLPAFGGAYLRRVYDALHAVIEKRIPLVITCAGPITVSDQHRAWLIPLIKAANTAYITVTDAICYHDGHDCLRKTSERPIREVDMWGDDGALREGGVIRVADTGFDEQVLFDQDAVATQILQLPTDGPYAKIRGWYKQFYHPRAEAAALQAAVNGTYTVRGLPAENAKAA